MPGDMNYVSGKVIKTPWDPLEGRCNLEMKSGIKMSPSLTAGTIRACDFVEGEVSSRCCNVKIADTKHIPFYEVIKCLC